jgi:6-pyruvoyltetrahydropterin/6-carboxytetrahydropterin synthase
LIEKEIVKRFDYQNLNLDGPEFKDLNPTAEHICYVIWTILRSKLPQKVDLQVRLYETPRNYVEFPMYS